jgi:L,D-peptidoglycan transpeptidase YkuD (ErfK/YbiS/YcfS/YnhG family)
MRTEGRWRATLIRAAVGLLAMGLLVPLTMATPAAAVTQPPFDPESVPGSQVVYVSAPKGSSYATMQLWQHSRQGWAQTLSVPARVGPPGISPDASEYVSYTPEGMFTLTEAFGRQHNPGAKVPFRYVGTSDRWWWVSDVNSKYYNQPYYCAASKCPFDTDKSENLGQSGPVYDYAVVMNYNRWPAIAGKGSAFFIHVTNGNATAGCVAGPHDAIVQLVRWLDPHQRPAVITKAT